jgi:hypothetical protein
MDENAITRTYAHSTLYLVVILPIACQRVRRTASERSDARWSPGTVTPSSRAYRNPPLASRRRQGQYVHVQLCFPKEGTIGELSLLLALPHALGANAQIYPA